MPVGFAEPLHSCWPVAQAHHARSGRAAGPRLHELPAAPQRHGWVGRGPTAHTGQKVAGSALSPCVLQCLPCLGGGVPQTTVSALVKFQGGVFEMYTPPSSIHRGEAGGARHGRCQPARRADQAAAADDAGGLPPRCVPRGAPLYLVMMNPILDLRHLFFFQTGFPGLTTHRHSRLGKRLCRIPALHG
jgi:hypothetical protein